MSIITVTHSAFGGGRALAERVAAILDHRCISREVLIEARQRYGIPEAKFSEVLETEPHWWERWVESLRLYRVTLQAAMCEVAQGGNLVYHGRGGQELFPGVRHVLKVYLNAPLEYRIEQVKARKGLNEGAARQYIEELDRIRGRRIKAIFGVDWRDVTRYDLVVNLARMSIETAAQLVVKAAQREEYQPSPESEQAFRDLTISARVQAALVVNPQTRNLAINVRVAKGEVQVSGILAQTDLEQTIVAIVKSIPGVTKVTAQFEAPPIEYMYP